MPLLKCPVFYITKIVKVSEKISVVRSNIRNVSDKYVCGGIWQKQGNEVKLEDIPMQRGEAYLHVSNYLF